jgi:hypothetical protein
MLHRSMTGVENKPLTPRSEDQSLESKDEGQPKKKRRFGFGY